MGTYPEGEQAMTEPNNAVKEIASYIMRHKLLKNRSPFATETDIAEGLQEMVDNGQIVGGLVVTGDHEVNGYIVLDWDRLGKPGLDLTEASKFRV